MRTMVTMMTKMMSLRTIVLKDKREPTTGGDGLWWNRMSEWFWSTQTTFFISSVFFTTIPFVFDLVNFSDNLLLYHLSSTYWHILFVFVFDNFLLNHPYSLPFILYVFVLVNLINYLLFSSKSWSKKIMPDKVGFRSIKNIYWFKRRIMSKQDPVSIMQKTGWTRLVWSGIGFHFGCDHLGCSQHCWLNSHFSVYLVNFGMVTMNKQTTRLS